MAVFPLRACPWHLLLRWPDFMRWLGGLLCLSSFAGEAGRAAEGVVELPTMHVQRTDDFTIRGDGSGDAWKKTEWVTLTRRPNAHHNYDARVKVLYSEKGLYVLYAGSDRQLTVSADKQDFDDLWVEDVFEFFLWTDPRYPVYFEYEISPLGKELPILVPNFEQKFMGWRPWHYEGSRKIQKQVHVEGGEAKAGATVTGWRAEIFLPYELLQPLQQVPPQRGTRWRANFYRVDYDDGMSTGWNWAAVGPSFHEHHKYGTLIFE